MCAYNTHECCIFIGLAWAPNQAAEYSSWHGMVYIEMAVLGCGSVGRPHQTAYRYFQTIQTLIPEVTKQLVSNTTSHEFCSSFTFMVFTTYSFVSQLTCKVYIGGRSRAKRRRIECGEEFWIFDLEMACFGGF